MYFGNTSVFWVIQLCVINLVMYASIISKSILQINITEDL